MLRSIIQELDESIGRIKLDPEGQTTLSKLLELRNSMLLKYRPDPNLDWTITNKQTLNVLNYFNWTVIYKN